MDTPKSLDYHTRLLRGTGFHPAIPMQENGAIAQLGERNTGSVEVGGSIPPGSTNKPAFPGSR